MPLRIAERSDSQDIKPAVVWEGAFLARHSLALVNRYVTRALTRSHSDLGTVLCTHPSDDRALAGHPRWRAIEERMGEAPGHANVWVRHHWPPNWNRPNTDRFVVIQPWEYGSLPEDWVEGIAGSVDEVWAYCDFVKQEYMESGVPEEKIRVMPLGVDPTMFDPSARARGLDTDRTFKFLFVGGTIWRKGIDVLLSAYEEEFSAEDDVCLVIKDFGAKTFYKGQGAHSEIERIRCTEGRPEIVYMDDDLADEDLPGLYTACDCLIHPYRGEGFGLPIAEAMACGLPVIATEFGACLDFCNHDNAYLIPAKVVHSEEKRVGDIQTVGFPYWAEPDKDALRHLMRDVYENRDKARSIGARASEHILSNFTWNNTAQWVNERLTTIVQAPATRNSGDRARGFRALNEGRWLEAATSLERVWADDESDAEAANSYALACVALGDHKKARAILGRSLQITPEFAETYYNLARLLAADGRALEAAENACRALELDPMCAEAVDLLEKLRPQVRAIKPSAKKSRKKARGGQSQARVDSVLSKINSVLRSAKSREQRTETTSDRPRLSLCMIAKDEEKFITECLQSVEGVADEIVIVDTGSSDRTVEIARSFGAHAHQYEWTDSYSDARNEALRHATGDWVLILDADERLDTASRDRVLSAIQNGTVDAYALTFRNYVSDNSDSDFFVHRTCRLFRNKPEYRFVGRVHERVVPSIEAVGGTLEHLDAVIHHYGYRPEIMAERGKHERYIRLLRADLDDSPEDTFCLYNLGTAYCNARDYENAVTFLSRASESVSPKHEFAAAGFVRLAAALSALGRSHEALSVLDDAESRSIRHPELSFERGNVFLRLGRYDEAIPAFEKAIREGQSGRWIGDPAAFGYKAYYGIAQACMGLGDYERAIESANRSLAENSDDADAHELLGAAYLNAGNKAKSEYHLQQAARLSSGHETTLRLAQAYESQGRYDDAVVHLSKALGSGTDDAQLRFRLGVCTHALGRLDEAQSAYLRAVELRPRFPEARTALGMLYAQQNRLEEALQSFAQAVEDAPTYSDAYLRAADTLYGAGKYLEASEVYQSGLAHAPDNARGFLGLGNCYFRLRAYEAATIAYRQALDLEPGYAEARSNLVKAEAAIGRDAA